MKRTALLTVVAASVFSLAATGLFFYSTLEPASDQAPAQARGNEGDSPALQDQSKAELTTISRGATAGLERFVALAESENRDNERRQIVAEWLRSETPTNAIGLALEAMRRDSVPIGADELLPELAKDISRVLGDTKRFDAGRDQLLMEQSD
jgi:hypothetical protein